MVARGDQAPRRHGPQGRRFQRSEEDRRFDQTLRDGELPPKIEPFRSAMSMLSLYINRAGNLLTKKKKNTLEQAREELRKDFGRKTKR